MILTAKTNFVSRFLPAVPLDALGLPNPIPSRKPKCCPSPILCLWSLLFSNSTFLPFPGLRPRFFIYFLFFLAGRPALLLVHNLVLNKLLSIAFSRPEDFVDNCLKLFLEPELGTSWQERLIFLAGHSLLDEGKGRVRHCSRKIKITGRKLVPTDGHQWLLLLLMIDDSIAHPAEYLNCSPPRNLTISVVLNLSYATVSQ